MKKALLLTAGVILYSCGGGGGGGVSSNSGSSSYKLAKLDEPEIAENTSTTSVRTVQSLTGVSEKAATSKSLSSSKSSKGWLITLLQKSVGQKEITQATRGNTFTIPCLNSGGYLNANIYYDLKDGVSQPQSCSDFRSIRIHVTNTSSEKDCVLGDYVIYKGAPFSMLITGSELKDPDCFPSKAEILVDDGVVVHLQNGTPDEAYDYNSLKIAYSNIVWNGDEIASVKYSVTGGANYLPGQFPDTNGRIDYYFNITGTGTETSDTFSGYIKLGCLDGWLKVDTLEPIKYSADGELQQGKIKVSAADGNFVIAYSDSGIDITETIGDKTETYHYNSFDEIKDSLQGVTCTYR